MTMLKTATQAGGTVTSAPFSLRLRGPSGSSLGVQGPHRHGDLREFFSNAVLHDAP
jgi:hypothetical protein